MKCELVPTDPVIEAVRADLLHRQQLGHKKYGGTLAENPAQLHEKLQHAYEESLDLCNYLKWVIMQLDDDPALKPDPNSPGTLMAARVLRPGERTYLDTDSRAMIYHGCSTKQLAELFGMKEPDVMRKVAGVASVGVGRQGNPLYRVRDVAAHLIKIPITPDMIEHYMVSGNPKNLPPATNAMFWQGMMTRRKYEETIGDLWHTSDVVQVASETFQSLRVSLLLIPDNISEKTELTEDQRYMVQGIIDAALEEARERLIGNLRKPSRFRPGPSTEEGDI